MKGEFKSREQLLKELAEARARLSHYESLDSARIRVEEGFQRSQTKNKALFLTVPSLIFVMRKDGTFIEFKASLDRSQKLFPAKVIGKNIRDMGFSQGCLVKLFRHIQSAIKKGSSIRAFYWRLFCCWHCSISYWIHIRSKKN